MLRRPPRSTRTDTLFPYPTLFRSVAAKIFGPLAEAAINVDMIVQNVPAETGRTDLTFTVRSEEHTSELQSLMRISYAVFCLKKKNKQTLKEHEITTSNITTQHLPSNIIHIKHYRINIKYRQS